jgi:asparagine synthase (glutamine-hydrolysing)
MIAPPAQAEPHQPGGSPIEVHGRYAPGRGELATLSAAGQFERIAAADGDFVIVVRGPSRDARAEDTRACNACTHDVHIQDQRASDTVITSASGIVNYFYARGPAGVCHGTEVAQVAEAAGRPWQWDFAAVADYLRLGHPLGSATLHAGVRRFHAGSVTTISPAGPVLVDTALDRTPAAASAGGPRNQDPRNQDPRNQDPRPQDPRDARHPARATAALLAAVAAVEPECALSMSGGLDSRALLAALLHLDRRPALIVSGLPGSFDREVATAIARRFGLALTAVEVTEADVRDGAAEVAAATCGLLPASNWAGLAHLRCLQGRGQAGAPILHGANGEYARSYFAPPGGIAALRTARHPAADLAQVWAATMPEPFGIREKEMICTGLRGELSPVAMRRRIAAAVAGLAEGPRAGGVLAAADEVFLRERGRGKTSADLAAIGRYAPWRVPFFAPGWTAAVRALPRQWKLGSALHRRMIAALCPALLRFPEEGYPAAVTRRRPPARYWVRGPGPGGPHYLDQRIFRGDLFAGHADAISDLIDPGLFRQVVAEQRRSGTRPHVAFALLALAMFREQGSGGLPARRI